MFGRKSSLVFLLLFLSSASYAQLVVNSDSAVHPLKRVASIVLLGNLHTHDEVIYRELTFGAGDTVTNLQKEIQRSRSNLINTLLFNFVDIKETKIDSMYSDVVVVVKERWYIWPFPIFKFADPNFNTWWINKDFSRTNYGIYLLWRNLRGWNEDLAFKTQLGYSKEFAMSYRMPYLTNRLRLGMQVSANYTQQEEITVGTFENKRSFYRSGTGKSRVEFGGRLSFFYRKKLYFTHTVDLRYQNLQVNDSVTKLTNDYFYQNKPHMEFPGIAYAIRYDKRDNKGYPLKGTLVQGELHKYGISLLGNKNLNVAWVSAYTKNYFQLGYRWYFASMLKFKYTLTPDLPYYFQQGLGYENYVRGYEYYIIDGQHYGLFKSNIKYNLIKSKTRPIEFLKSTNFYMFHASVFLNLFFDAGYVHDDYYFLQNQLANQVVYSTGLGLDLVVFYDKVLRLEVALNKQNQTGFFIHFIQPI